MIHNPISRYQFTIHNITYIINNIIYNSGVHLKRNNPKVRNQHMLILQKYSTIKWKLLHDCCSVVTSVTGACNKGTGHPAVITLSNRANFNWHTVWIDCKGQSFFLTVVCSVKLPEDFLLPHHQALKSIQETWETENQMKEFKQT